MKKTGNKNYNNQQIIYDTNIDNQRTSRRPKYNDE